MLDIASGHGEPGLSVLAQVPGLHLTVTDVAPVRQGLTENMSMTPKLPSQRRLRRILLQGMLEQAKAEAKQRGITAE